MKELTAQTGIIVKCSKTAIEFFQNAQSVDFFSALEIPKEFQDIAIEFYDLILENDHPTALLGCRGNYDIAIQIDEVTGTMMGWIGSNEGNGMIEYIKLFWEGAPEGEPSVILYEVDTGNERLALRSIDIFMDGHTHNIPDLYDGTIEITSVPIVEELNAHAWGEEFHACVIEKAEFETIWENHTYDGALKESGGF